jgi:predicted nucleic acid-binding protein
MDQNEKMDEHFASIAPGDKVVTCTIVRGEVLYGIHILPRGRRRDGLAATASAAFASLPSVPIPRAAADAYAEVKSFAKTAGLVLNDNDFWIAATARVMGAILVTRDSDFSRLPGLRVENWTV